MKQDEITEQAVQLEIKKKKKKLRQTRTSLRYPEGIDKGRKPRGCRFVFW